MRIWITMALGFINPSIHTTSSHQGQPFTENQKGRDKVIAV